MTFPPGVVSFVPIKIAEMSFLRILNYKKFEHYIEKSRGSMLFLQQILLKIKEFAKTFK